MDREWVGMQDRTSVEYAAGVNKFIAVAKQTVNSKGLTLCPCVRCMNRQKQPLNIIKVHLINWGILTDYKRWHRHGEPREEVSLEDVEIVDQHDLAAGLHDATDDCYFDIGSTVDVIEDDRPVAECKRYKRLFESLDNPLYTGCKNFSALSFIVKLMNIKVLSKWSDDSFEMLLKLLNEVLPSGHHCPDSYYNIRRLLCDMGLGYEHIDVCQHGCVLFNGDNAQAQSCPVCGTSRYDQNKIPHKRMRYFPKKPRLNQLCGSQHTTTGGRRGGIGGDSTVGRASFVGRGFTTSTTSRGSTTSCSATEGVDATSTTTASNGKRGITCGKGTLALVRATTHKLPVEFDGELRQATCNNAERFNNEIGYNVRTFGRFGYKEWRLVPEEVRAPIREKLTECFDIDLCDEATLKSIDAKMRRAWKTHKYKLHKYFLEIEGDQHLEWAKTQKHPECKHQEDWEKLCDYWSGDKFQSISEKNVESRGKRKWASRNGSVTTARVHIRRGEDFSSSTGQIDTWRLGHWDSEHGWIAPELEGTYDRMMALRAQNTPEELSDKQIMERILGRDSVRLRGRARSLTTEATSDSMSG